MGPRDWPLITWTPEHVDAAAEILAIRQEMADMQRRCDHMEELLGEQEGVIGVTQAQSDWLADAVRREETWHERSAAGFWEWITDLRRRDESCQVNRSRIMIGVAIGCAIALAGVLGGIMAEGARHWLAPQQHAAAPPAAPARSP